MSNTSIKPRKKPLKRDPVKLAKALRTNLIRRKTQTKTSIRKDDEKN